MTGKDLDDVTDEERKGAKAVNFGAIYGQGAGGLVQSAWAQFDIVLDFDEAKAWLQAFADTYPASRGGGAIITERCEERRLHRDRQGQRPRDRPDLPQEPRSRRRVVTTPAAAICRFRAPAPTLRCWRSPMSTIGCSTPGSRAVRSRGCTTRSCSKSATIRPIRRPRFSSRR